MRRKENPSGAFLQGIILFVIFGKIQSPGFQGYPLGGVITETEALGILLPDSLFGAEDFTVLQFGTMNAVRAPGFNFFTKQHSNSSFLFLMGLYNNTRCISTPFFQESQKETGEKRSQNHTTGIPQIQQRQKGSN